MEQAATEDEGLVSRITTSITEALGGELDVLDIQTEVNLG